MKITIDTEGANYDILELMGLAEKIQTEWMKMGRGLKETYSMSFDTNKYQETIKDKQKQGNDMLKANIGDI